MLLSGGELDGVRILTPDTLQLMTTNSLPADIRFAMDWIGPRAGASWGLGFEVRTNPGFSSVPGAVEASPGVDFGAPIFGSILAKS